MDTTKMDTNIVCIMTSYTTCFLFTINRIYYFQLVLNRTDYAWTSDQNFDIQQLSYNAMHLCKENSQKVKE